MPFPRIDPIPDPPPPPREDPEDLPRRDEDPFQFPPDSDEQIEPLDPDDEPEDQAPLPPV